MKALFTMLVLFVVAGCTGPEPLVGMDLQGADIEGDCDLMIPDAGHLVDVIDFVDNGHSGDVLVQQDTLDGVVGDLADLPATDLPEPYDVGDLGFDTGFVPDGVEDAPIGDLGGVDAGGVVDSGADVAPDAIADAGYDVTQETPLTLADFDAALTAGSTGDSSLLDDFLARYDMPICDGGTCLFVTRVPGAFAVSIAGDHNAWTSQSYMTAVSFASDVFFQVVDMTPAPAVDYKLIADGEWLVDPLNKYFRFGPYGPNSTVYGAGVGRLTTIRGVQSSQLGNTRDLYVYLPDEYFTEPSRRFGVIYFQDGFNVFTNPQAPFGSWDVEETANRLFPAGSAEPVIIVGIDTDDRYSEYLYTSVWIDHDDIGWTTPKLDAYLEFVVSTVKAKIDKEYRTLPGREHTAMAGSSLGGISSLYMVWRRSDVFGLVGAFSPSLWVGESGLDYVGSNGGSPSMRQIIKENADQVAHGSIRIYMDSGDSEFDGTVRYRADAWVATDWTRNALIASGWDNRAEWDTDGEPATVPADLSPDTSVGEVPHLSWAIQPPHTYSGWGDYLGIDNNLLVLVGHGHMHNEAAWKPRFDAALRFLFPVGGVN